MTLEEYEYFMETLCWLDKSNECLLILKGYSPPEFSAKVIVDYNREAWTSKLKDGVRISFDHNIRYRAGKDLFPEDQDHVSDLKNWW